jgi:hypothetical protein
MGQNDIQGLESLLGRKVTVAHEEKPSKPVEVLAPKVAPTLQANHEASQDQSGVQGLEKLLGRKVTIAGQPNASITSTGEGYSEEEQAQKRAHEYDYAIKSGMSPERAEKFANALKLKASKKVLTPEEKQAVADQYAAIPIEDRKKGGIDLVTDPQEYANGYAEARAFGADEGEAEEYGRSQPLVRASIRASNWIGGKYANAKVGLLHLLGQSDDASHVKAEDAVSGSLISTLFGRTQQDWEYGIQKDAGWVDKHLGKTVGTLQEHLDHLIAGFTTPDMAAMEAATLGAGTLEGALPEVGAEATTAARATRFAQRSIRNTGRLAHIGFTTQMAQGTVESGSESVRQFAKGNVSEGMGYALDALVNGVMVTAGVRSVDAHAEVHSALDKKTGEVFSGKKFDQLSDQQQGLIVNRLIEDDPQFKMAADASEKEARKAAKRLRNRYSAAVRNTWNPNAVERAIRAIDDHRAAVAEEDAKRSHYLNQITKLIDLHKQDKADEAEVAAAEEERRAAGREDRPVRKTEAAKKREEQRKVTLTNAGQIAEARQGVGTAREEADRETVAQEQAEKPEEPQGAVRHPDVVTDDEGHVSYRGQVFGGEEHHFGAARDPEGNYGIYRRTPDGVEYLGAGGIFEENPTEGFRSADQATAETLAQITSLRVNAAYAVEEHGSTPEREAEHSQLRNLERQLVDGEITGEQARKAAGLPEEKVETEERKSTTSQEIEAARAGALNGPLHGRTRAELEDNFLSELEGAGWSPEDIEAAIDTIGLTLRMEAENNLHYVSRSGDWIAGKKGTTWVLDSKGILQPDDGLSAPIPLMKNGRYSAQALDLSMSGRVGFGQRSFEDSKVESAKEREAERKLENLVGNVADELQRAIELGKQNAGLQMEAGELPVERPAPKRRSRFAPPVEGEMGVSPERETDRAVEEGYAASQAERKSLDETWINAIGDSLAENNESAWDLIQRVAKNSGLSPQEVLKIQLGRLDGPDTLEGKIDRLKAGDTISDSMGLPWVVKSDKNGTLYLRKGDGARIHINKFKPSDDVRRIVGRGEITKAPGPAFTPDDVRRAAYEAPYITRRQESVERVKELKENPPPAPKTTEQAQVQLAEAEVREVQVKDAAVEATEAAVNPVPKTTDPEIDKAVAKSEELRKVAAEASAQTAKAKGRSAGPGMYPQKASISAKGFPSKRGLVGFDSYVQTDAGRIPVHIELVRLDRLTTSFRWNGNELERQPDYLEAMQDVPPDERTRMDLLSDAQPGNYDADRYLDPGYGPENGPAIVDTGGDVAGGNRRLLRMLKNLELIGSDETALAIFKDKMRLYALRNGMEYPEGEEIYIPVRMMNEPIGTVARASELGALFNKPASHGIDEDAKSITYGILLGEAQATETAGDSGKVGILDRIGNEFNSADTPREAMANNPKFFIQVVKDYFHIGAAESADWFGKNMSGEETLKEEGREKIEKALLATILKNPSTLADIRKNAPNAYESLLKCIGPMTRLRDIPDKDITGLVEEAVAAVAQTARKRVEGDSPKMRWNNTYAVTDMYSTEPPPQEPGPVVEALWRALHDRKTTRFKNALNDYLVGEGPQKNFFELVQDHLTTPVELFNAAFEKELKEVRDSRGVNSEEAHKGNFKGDDGNKLIREFLDKQAWELTQDQFDAALRNQPEETVEYPEAKPISKQTETASSSTPNEKTVKMLTDAKTGGRRLDHFLENQLGVEILSVKSESLDPSKLTRLQGWTREGKLNEWEGANVSAKDFPPVEVVRTASGDYLYDGTHRTEFATRQGEKIPAKVYTISTRDEAFPVEETGAMTPPPELSPKPEVELSAAKGEKGYVTSGELEKFLTDQTSTADHAPEIMRTARMMAEYVFDADPPEGVERTDALDWILKDRVAKLVFDEKGKGRGSYSDPDIEKGIGTRILKLTKAADATSFIHEFAHVVFPFLSEEDMRALDTITGVEGERWRDGEPLRGEAYKTVSEKFASGLEKFLRDENPTGFSAEVKKVLAKVKEMFQKAYMRFSGDPLSPFNLSEEARGVFADMFHIEDFDVADEWKKQRDAARKAETKQKKGMVKPEEKLHPVQQIAKDLGPKPVQILESIEGAVEDSSGDRVDPSKPMVALVYEDEAEAAQAYLKAAEEGSGVAGVEFVAGKDGKYAVRFNVKTKVPKSILYQDVPVKHPGLRLEDMEAKLKTTTSPILKRFLETQIAALKAEIRHEPKPEGRPELAKQAIAEVKNATRKIEPGRPGVSNLRGVSDGPLGDGKQSGVGRLSKPPVMGMPGHAGAGGAADRIGPGRGNAQPVNLANVTPVKLNPLPERGTPVGILAGEAFDEKAWREGNKRAGLPDNMPAPTVTLSPEVARVLKYGGQKQTAQMILSALEQGDGAVIASSTGAGKTYTSGAVIKETLLKNPDAKILLITKNRGLLKTAAQIGKDNFGYEMEVEAPEGALDKNVYGASYQRLLNNPIYAQTQWDLVISDESGEARNWHQEQNQQGKLLKAVMDNAKKGVYVSATPFHSPMEYGYLDKLNLWPKGGFENWIKENFAHEKVGDKIIAKLDPAKQAKMRQQLIERGQMVSQEISYDGFTTHFGVVPVTDVIERKLDRIHQGIAVARRELLKQGKKGLSERIAAFEATYTKAFLERSRLPEAIQLAKRARAAGWQVIFFSETTSEDLFRRPVGPKEEPGTYRLLDEETGGQVSRIMPEFPNIMDELRSEFGDEIGDYSGSGNTDAQREESKDAFLKGKKPLLYTSYAAGGIGVSLHDEEGNKPRVSIFLGPPYSGVLLEQSLGRTWRFGVKSNAMAVFLATDSEPDIRLMATKVGPRMRALRASVLGERDSLASVMANYTDEEKMREHQDMLAFDQGNEVKVDAQGFQVRSKRKVNFDNWSSITFPNAEEAKNKGMQVEMSGGGKGSDWATLYQEKPKRWEPPNRPLTIEDIRIRRAVNAAADKAAANPQIPHEEITMTAVRAEEVAKAAPEGVDKEAAAEGVMKTLFRGEVALQGEGGGWTVAHDAVKNMAQGVRVDDERPWKKRLWDYQFSQDSNIVHTLRKLGKEGVGWNIVNMREDFYQKEDQYDADHLHDLLGIFTGNKLNPHDENTVRKIIDVVEGHQAVADPAINKAAGELSEFMKRMRDFMAEKNVSLVAKDGTKVPYKNIAADPKHIPHFINYDAKLTDPKTGETKTLREVMGHTFGELNRLRYMEEYARKIGKPVEEARVWIADLEKRMKGARLGQVRAERSVNIPFYYKDFKHLVKYVEQVSTAASMEETFGGEMENLKKEIAKVPNEQARKDILTGFTTMFEVPDWNTSAGKIVRKGQGFEALTKMPLSVLKVPFHLVHATMKVGLKSVGKAGIEWLKNPNEFRDEKFQLGVTGGRTDNAWILEGGGDHGLGGAVFKGTGFDIAYRWVRGIAGESAKVYMEQRALGGLKKGGSIAEEVRRILKHTMLIGDHAIDEAVRTGKWSEDDLEKAQRAFANKVTFNSRNPGQMPELARMSMAKDLSTAQKNLNTSLRGTYALQSFTIKTYSFLRDALYDEVVIHHNLKPLIPFLLLYPVAGQLITGTTSGTKHIFNLTSEKIQDKEHVHDSWDTWLQQFDNIEHHPVIGALKFWIDGACVAAAMERTKRVADLVLLMSEGHKKQADDMMKYWIDDELEQDFGSIYTDMLYFAKAGTDEVRDLWKYTEDHAKQLTATEKHVFGELEKLVPLSKDMPYVDDLAHQYIKTGPKKWAVEGGDDEPPKEKRKKWAAPTPWD